MTRSGLIYPFLAELHAPVADAASLDADFREAAMDEPATRPERPPVRALCQVEPQALEALRMYVAGDSPRSSLALVFSFSDLTQRGLVDPASGLALIRPGWRLGAIYDLAGQLVERVGTPPGLYATETRPMGFGPGLGRWPPRRHLLLVTFEDRRTATPRNG